MTLPVLRLRTWLVLSYLVVFVLPVAALLCTGALASDLRMQTREDLEHQAALLALHIESGPPDDLRPFLRQAKALTLAGFRVVDTGGVVVASSGDTIGEDLSAEPEVAEALLGSTATAIREREGGRGQLMDSRSRHAGVRIFVAMPILREGAVTGAVVLSRTPREEVQTLWQMAPRLSVGVLAALASTVGLAFSAGRILSRSLEGLARASQGIASGSETALAELDPSGRSHVAEARALAAAMRRMSTRLRERLAYISEFAGNVSHEFKTPVSSLRGTVELLRDDDDMPPEQRARFLDNALADLDRLSRLVGGLLRLARAEEGGAREIVELDAVLQAVRARHEGLVVTGRAGAVEANREQIEVAIGNLVENAVRHGTARAEAWVEGATTGVDIVDDGPGISPANLPRVFDRFFTTNRAAGGTGLGLALVRAICESHGGTITAESAPGRTCFRISLPRRE